MEIANKNRKSRWSYLAAILLILVLTTVRAKAVDVEENEIDRRMSLYKEFSYASGVPWYQIAAIDQYERNIASFRKGPAADLQYETISVRFDPHVWSGAASPVAYETDLRKINLFCGLGMDGDGDNVADIHNEQDVMFAMVTYLNGYSDFEAAVDSFYQNEHATRIILGIARLFEKYEHIDLSKRSFPVNTNYNYSYTNGFGAARGWGGRRSHEGVDVFASYGVPVLSTSYGIVEVVGWNDYGGYRVGIRDIYNTYQYYAHLQWFGDDIEVGSIVEPGQVIGSVGSSGYGKEGTSGKFVPHLHYGLYKFDGRIEWAFNPYPYLVRWEKES